MHLSNISSNSNIVNHKNILRSLLMILLLLEVTSIVSINAQIKTSLESMIKTAIDNSPRLKNKDLSIKNIEATRGEIMEISPIELNYSWGQINGDIKNDKQLSVIQHLGSLLTPFYKNSLVNNKINTEQYCRIIIIKEITAEVKRAWTYYLYCYNINKLYCSQNEILSKLQKEINTKPRQEEINLHEKNRVHLMISELHKKEFEAKEEEKLALNRLNWICYSKSSIIPNQDNMDIFMVNDSSEQTQEVHYKYLMSKVQEAKTELKIEKSHFFPEISVGYVRQNILPLKNINSWMIGLAFPLYFIPQSSRIKTLKNSVIIANREAEANIKEMYNKVTELKSIISRQAKSMEYYTSSALIDAEEMYNIAYKELENDKISFTDFVETINTIIEIRSSYLETIYKYNVAILEYELFK